MTREAPLAKAGEGLEPAGPGWFVVNARAARWRGGETFGFFTPFESREHARFEQLGINVAVLAPGQPACMYHREGDQEDFLILSGECMLLIEGEERRMKAWDLVHCPPWTEHVLVGAGDGPCVLVGVGARQTRAVVYPASELAQSYGAGVDEETSDPERAYARFPEDRDVEYRREWLG